MDLRTGLRGPPRHRRVQPHPHPPDRRNAVGLVDPEAAPVEAEIPVTIWLPESDTPLPVVVYGHGLS